ncbi:MAG: GTPase HflX [Pirellulales bacterium]|nr:GTPase HflX [Pirellulales bacterium]
MTTVILSAAKDLVGTDLSFFDGIPHHVKELSRTDSVVAERAVLVGLLLDDRAKGVKDPLAELAGLAETAGIRVVGSLTQRRQRPLPSTYLGSGKVEELRLFVEVTEADLVVFDTDLSPGQTRNLEKATDVKVLDRTELILDIFASHARTHQARLAVELAQLEYAMPRLKRMWTHLSRQAQGGVGLRGPGEKQLEVDRRLAGKRIRDLRRDLEVIEQRKQREVAARRDRMTVSLVGYTNAGKSTLLNALTGADVFVEDALFATLDTRTRRWQLPGWGPVLLSDTVGFIRDLPHHLIESFKATLEESRQADLLLHVADAANPAVAEQIGATYRVLEELGIDKKNTLLVLNKIDMLPDRAKLDSLRNRYPNAVAISAQSGRGLDELAAAVSRSLSRGFVELDVEMGVDNGRLMAYLAAKGEVFSKNYQNGRVTIHCRLPERHLGSIRGENVEIRPHGEDVGSEE